MDGKNIFYAKKDAPKEKQSQDARQRRHFNGAKKLAMTKIWR
jgi:hypothetical protein